jgi:hypothetical protein
VYRLLETPEWEAMAVDPRTLHPGSEGFSDYLGRVRAWVTETLTGLPLPADLLTVTAEEWRGLFNENPEE